MTRVTMLKTSDGKLHNTTDDAIRYAEQRYGNALTTLAHKLVVLGKYNAVVNFLDNNRDAFIELLDLSNDRMLPTDEVSHDEVSNDD